MPLLINFALNKKVRIATNNYFHKTDDKNGSMICLIINKGCREFYGSVYEKV